MFLMNSSFSRSFITASGTSSSGLTGMRDFLLPLSFELGTLQVVVRSLINFPS